MHFGPIFSIIAVVSGAAALVLAGLFFPLKRFLRRTGSMGPRWARNVTIGFFVVPILFAMGSAWYLAYPPTSFFKEEYVRVLDEQPHPQAKFLRMYASYPGIQGDYASVSLVRLPEAEFERLEDQLSVHEKFERGAVWHGEEYRKMKANLPQPTPQEGYVRTDTRGDQQLSVIFIPERSSILVQVFQG